MYDTQLDEYALLITREETYTNVGNDENRNLKPLNYVGKDY